MSSGKDMDVRFRLELDSRPEAVTLIRSVIATIAGSTQLSHSLVDDLCTAVSEAANNVVLHAYPNEHGPLLFSLRVQRDQVEAVVRDHGCGMRRVSITNRGLGMGVVVIDALADQAEFQSDVGNGTEVRMKFKLPVQPVADFNPRDLALWSLADPRASTAQQAR